MAVYVDRSEHGRWCIDTRCSLPARLVIQPTGQSPLAYCLDHFEDRLTFHKGRGEQIAYTDEARELLESERRRVIT